MTGATSLDRPSSSYSRPLHLTAWATAITTFPLIFMGGLVTSHGAGLAVNDWPHSEGYLMWLMPLNRWFGPFDVFLEHTHRVIGSIVGLLAIILLAGAWRTRQRPGVRWLAAAILGSVIVQGVLGGLRVVWRDLDLAVVHGVIAHAVFCLTALAVVMTSRRWYEPSRAWAIPGADSIGRLAAITTGAIFVQLIIGAMVRHYNAALAIPDFPLVYGKFVPPLSPTELAAANVWRSGTPHLGDTTLWLIWLHFAHRQGAVLVLLAVTLTVAWMIRARHSAPELVREGVVLSLLLAIQWVLGILTVVWQRPKFIATLHVAVGALLLLVLFVTAVKAFRAGGPKATPRFAPGGIPA